MLIKSESQYDNSSQLPRNSKSEIDPKSYLEFFAATHESQSKAPRDSKPNNNSVSDESQLNYSLLSLLHDVNTSLCTNECDTFANNEKPKQHQQFTSDDILLSPKTPRFNYRCNKCGNSFAKLLHYSIHYKSCFNQSFYTCLHCHYFTYSATNFYRHVQNHSSFHRKCPRCNLYIKDFQVFMMHLQIHILELETELDNISNLQIYPHSAHNIHPKQLLFKELPVLCKYNILLESFNCDRCGLSVRSKFRLWLHKSRHKSRYNHQVNLKFLQ